MDEFDEIVDLAKAPLDDSRSCGMASLVEAIERLTRIVQRQQKPALGIDLNDVMGALISLREAKRDNASPFQTTMIEDAQKVLADIARQLQRSEERI